MSLTNEYESLRDVSLLWRRGEVSGGVSYGCPESWDGFNWAADWFDELARVIPDQTAVDLPGRGEVATYAQLSQLSHDAARWLTACGVEIGSVVRVALDESLDLWVILLALDRLGAVIVQVQPFLPAAELRRRTPQGMPLYQIDPRGLCPPGGAWCKLPQWSTEARKVSPARLPARAAMWAYYTSGTTGKPKLAVHNRVSYAVGHLSSVAFHDLTPGTRHANLAGPGWAKFAWSSFYVVFASASTYVGLGDLRAEMIPRGIIERRVETLCASPSKWRTLEKVAEGNVCLLDAFSAGEPLSLHTARAVERALGCRPRSVFGMTEMTAAIGEREAGAGMEVLPGYEARVAAGAALEVKPGLSLMEGYATDGVKVPHATSFGEWIRTGDRAETGPDGGLFVLGRLDDLINIDGHLRSPVEIEAEIEASLGAGRCLVYQDSMTERVIAAVEDAPIGAIEVPPGVDEVQRVKKLPRTPSGKLRRVRDGRGIKT